MIGNAWDISDPKRPVAEFDSNADIGIPIGLTAWLDGLGTTYASHSVIAPAPLQCMDDGVYGSDAAGTVVVRMRVDPAATFVRGRAFPFTVRVLGADGTTKDDRTFWLRVVDR